MRKSPSVFQFHLTHTPTITHRQVAQAVFVDGNSAASPPSRSNGHMPGNASVSEPTLVSATVIRMCTPRGSLRGNLLSAFCSCAHFIMPTTIRFHPFLHVRLSDGGLCSPSFVPRGSNLCACAMSKRWSPRQGRCTRLRRPTRAATATERQKW